LSAIGVGLSTVQSIERRKGDERRLRWTVAVGFISTVAIPLTLLFGFFGIIASGGAAVPIPGAGARLLQEGTGKRWRPRSSGWHDARHG
jgi:hypothetical protein